MVLLDAAIGGSGVPFDWTVLEGLDRLFMLAGGLSPANMQQALKLKYCVGVDICSGVEVADSAPLRKDHAAIQLASDTISA